MASNKYRVTKEIILQIAENCDLATLSALTRTCKDIHSLITSFEHSISQAKIAASYQPPQDLVLSSEDEQRCTILERNTFATVQELERREYRIESLLDRCGFLLTSDPKILGMPSESLEKFKAGLRDAIYLADELADLATRHPIPKHTRQIPHLFHTAMGLTATDSYDTTSFGTIRQRRGAQVALRRAQVAHIRSRASRDLAWLVTLAAGGSKGFARYSARLLESDPAMADARIMAFKEVLLRHGGSMVLWSFLRGSKTLGTFVRQAVGECAVEVLFFEENLHLPTQTTEQDLDEDEGEGEDEDEGEEMPGGLHMCIMEELNQRIVKEKTARASQKGEFFDGIVNTWEVWQAVDALVGKEVGCETWKGYGAIRYPQT